MKAVAELLKERYPNSEIVYSKARLVAQFRQAFDCLKSRTFNDLHHAKDAYLNIVVGNVYHMRFSRQWFDPNSRYSIKTEALFKNPVSVRGELVWDGARSLDKVKKVIHKNNAHFTKYAFFKTGGLFDQNPVRAGEGLVPLKKGLSTEKYGGYNGAAIMFFIPVRYEVKNTHEITIMSVELMYGKRFLADMVFAERYTYERLKKILGKEVKDVSFPMGRRPWKVNTMLSLDGFRVCITGGANRGKAIIVQPVMQFSAGGEWEFYIKKLEMLVQKAEERPNYIYSEEYDKVTVSKNMELYRLYVDKLKNTIYMKRCNVPTLTLEEGINEFEALPSVVDQAKALLNIHQLFCRNSGGCDLSAIGGKGKSVARSRISTNVSNWMKQYRRATIVDSSPSGLWAKESCNILELL
jgi:CRISPR-associated endonuclease Csn1